MTHRSNDFTYLILKFCDEVRYKYRGKRRIEFYPEILTDDGTKVEVEHVTRWHKGCYMLRVVPILIYTLVIRI